MLSTNLRFHHFSPDISLVLSEGISHQTTALLEDHLFVWVISGQTRVVQAHSSVVLHSGNSFILPHHQIVRFVNGPARGNEYKALVIKLSHERLRVFYSRQSVIPSLIPLATSLFHLHSTSELDSCYQLFVDLYRQGGKLKKEDADNLIFSLIDTLRITEPRMDSLLPRFDKPTKVDLVLFMEEHFIFNISVEELSYLTGRSISAFNRDFRKAFNMPPQQWLTKRRLALAHQYLTTSQKRPVDVYREVGFENLSHFSFAFRKQYGYSPKEAVGSQATRRLLR
jgi:AraC-like DNA-binding protein